MNNEGLVAICEIIQKLQIRAKENDARVTTGSMTIEQGVMHFKLVSTGMVDAVSAIFDEHVTALLTSMANAEIIKLRTDHKLRNHVNCQSR